MKRISLFFFLAVLTVILTGCYSTRQVSMVHDYQAACQGLSKAEAISRFGEPSRRYMENETEVFVYEEFLGEPNVLNRRYMDLVFDAQGVCRSVRTNYTKTEQYRDDKKTNWTIWGSIAGTAVAAGVFVPVGLLIDNGVREKSAK